MSLSYSKGNHATPSSFPISGFRDIQDMKMIYDYGFKSRVLSDAIFRLA